MDINSLYHKARTIRLFTKEEVSQDAFHTILENVRVASNATNRQILRYIVIKNPELVSAINNSVIYASLLPQKSNSPQLDQFPPYYIGIVQTQPSAISDIDTGIAADVIKTSAASMNLGTCIMASFKNLDTLLHIKDKEVCVLSSHLDILPTKVLLSNIKMILDIIRMKMMTIMCQKNH